MNMQLYWFTLLMCFIIITPAVLYLISFKKAPQGLALLRTGFGRTKAAFSGIIAYPIIHQTKLVDIKTKVITIEKSGREHWKLKDNCKLEGRFTFYVRINGNEKDVLKAAFWIGDDTIESKVLPRFKELFEHAIITIFNQTNAENWKSNRERLKMEIVSRIGADLYGFILDDLAIDRVKVH
ncbi:MAG: SPFH domain-containing protein [Flammeovirgaceae bacterium]